MPLILLFVTFIAAAIFPPDINNKIHDGQWNDMIRSTFDLRHTSPIHGSIRYPNKSHQLSAAKNAERFKDRRLMEMIGLLIIKLLITPSVVSVR